MRQVAGLALIAVLAAACGPKTPTTPATETPTLTTQGPAPAQAAAIDPNAPPPACTKTLDVTGVCADGHPSRFRAVTAAQQLMSPKCFWYTDQVMVDDKTAIAFRTQDCKAEGWDNAAYGFSDNKLKTGSASTPYAIDRVILSLFPVPAGKTAEAVALETLATAPEAERKRCEIHAQPSTEVAGDTFLLAPKNDFQKELDARNEVYEACGDYGVGDNAATWEKRGAYAFYHHLGQEAGYWDPSSFTFYRKDAAGAWTKTAD